MTTHISGADIDVMLGTSMINVKQFTVNVEDGTKPTYTRGIPDGYVRGATSASGEIVLDTANYLLVIEEAKKAGSIQQLETFDITGLGKTVDQTLKVVAYGCKLRFTKVLDAGGEGGDKLEHTIPYDVTDSRFIKINGVSYLDENFVTQVNKVGN